MDRSGSVLFTLGTGKGHGRGELFKRKWLSFFQEERIIYVWDSKGKIQTFSALTDEYLESLGRVPANVLVPKQDDFLTLGRWAAGSVHPSGE